MEPLHQVITAAGVADVVLDAEGERAYHGFGKQRKSMLMLSPNIASCRICELATFGTTGDCLCCADDRLRNISANVLLAESGPERVPFDVLHDWPASPWCVSASCRSGLAIAEPTRLWRRFGWGSVVAARSQPGTGLC